jgi:23S rRNA pseudouridine1911/1915/1917 synthase
MADELEFYEVPFEVEANYAGWRLDRYLCEKIPRLSRTRVQELIRNSLRTEGAEKSLKPSTPVKAGLRFWLRKRVLEEPPTTDEPSPVLYQDEHMVAVDKPSGLPMHPTARYFKGTLVARLREMAGPGEKLDPAHRLDRETSGIVLCGKRPEVTTRLKADFAHSRIHKTYLALVEGSPDFERRTIDLPLSVGGEVVRIKVVVDHANGKEAITEVEVVASYRDASGAAFAMVRCRPKTGRQHQIRAHLGHVGLPLVGDKIYGPDENYFVRFTEHALDEEALARLRLPRHALHAAEVSFDHPVTRKPLVVSSPLAADLQAFLDGLKRL